MISKIRLENYRSYEDGQFDLSPLTILSGGNSSGKSTVIKSLLLLKQSLEAKGPNFLTLNGEYAEIGQYPDLVHSTVETNGEYNDLSFDLEFYLAKSSSATLPIYIRMFPDARYTLNQIDHYILNVHYVFSHNFSRPYVANVKSIELSLITYFKSETDITNFALSAKIEHNTKYVNDPNADSLYSVRLKNFPLSHSGYQINIIKEPFWHHKDDYYDCCMMDFHGMSCKSILNGSVYAYEDSNLYKKQATLRAQHHLDFLRLLFDTISHEVDILTYLGPLRESPSRMYSLKKIYSEIGVKGEFTAQFLEQNFKTETKALLHDQTTYSNTLDEALSDWAEYLEIGPITFTDNSRRDLTQIQIDGKNIADVGFGVGQILPILVAGLTMKPGSTLILEQPEIHLHPKMQMAMTDFLISLIRDGKKVIIETHSDHIINRLVRRCTEDPALIDFAKIYFIEKDKNNNCSIPKEVKLDAYYGIAEAPAGFFDQYATETQMIVRNGFMNKRRISHNNA